MLRQCRNIWLEAGNEIYESGEKMVRVVHDVCTTQGAHLEFLIQSLRQLGVVISKVNTECDSVLSRVGLDIEPGYNLQELGVMSADGVSIMAVKAKSVAHATSKEYTTFFFLF